MKNNRSDRHTNLDLSNCKIAVAGGHGNLRKKLVLALSRNYNLPVRNFREIPSFKESRSNSKKKIRSKLTNVDLTIVITKYIGHDLSKIISDLKKCKFIENVLALDCQNTNRIVDQIICHFAQ